MKSVRYLRVRCGKCERERYSCRGFRALATILWTLGIRDAKGFTLGMMIIDTGWKVKYKPSDLR